MGKGIFAGVFGEGKNFDLNNDGNIDFVEDAYAYMVYKKLVDDESDNSEPDYSFGDNNFEDSAFEDDELEDEDFEYGGFEEDDTDEL